MDSTDSSNNAAVTRISVASPSGHESKGLATVCASQSAASTSHSSAQQAQDLRISKQGAQGIGFLQKDLAFSRLWDIDRVADFVEEGARLVVKLADEIEAMAHIAELSAQEAENLALKVEAKTKIVKQTLDAIADVLEGDKKLSTVLTDYATQKKAAAVTETPNIA